MYTKLKIFSLFFCLFFSAGVFIDAKTSTKINSVFERIPVANIKQKQDYFRTRSVIFNRNATFIGRLSKDQREIIELEGVPDYNRTFRTLPHGRLVKEWVYLDKDYLMQFIDGKLVYLGPVDDKEKIIIHYGQPTFIRTQELSNGRQEIYFYRDRWLLFVFSNDALAQGIHSGL